MAGEIEIPNGINLEGAILTGLGNPVDGDDAINRDYLEAQLGALRLKNVVYVNTIADLPTASGGNRNFLAKTYLLDEATFTDSNTWTLVHGTQIIGQGKNVTIVNYTGSGNFINYTNATVSIECLELQASSGTIFNVTNTSAYSTFSNDVNFRNCLSLGTVNGGACLMRYNFIGSCGTGIIFSGTLASVILDTVSFRALTGGANSYHVKVLTGTTGISFRCNDCIFDVATNHYGIKIDGTYTLSSGGIIKANLFSGTGAVANRLSGVNGNTTGWTILYGTNNGIAGLQYTDVEVISTSEAVFGNTAGTYAEASTVRGYVLPLSDYDPLATVIEAKVIAEITSVEATFQIGIRNITAGTNIGGLKTAVVPGTLGSVDSDFVAITPNRIYNAYYVKSLNIGANVPTRYALKIRVKTY